MVQEKEQSLLKRILSRVTEKAFDDFAGQATDEKFNRTVLGIE